MRRLKIFMIMVAMFFTSSLYAQNLEAILEFMGADAAEELSPHDVERMEDLLARPLRINLLSAARLEESGLFTHYQAASLADYRSRHGDILSLSELSALDGFGRNFVSRLAPFISLESRRIPGKSARHSFHNDLSVRTGIRTGSALTYGLKYKFMAGERLSGGISVSRTSDAPHMAPDACSGHVAIHMKRVDGKVLVGDFNARFGQGLTLWNGLSFGGLTSASSFMRKPSGISASSSFTGGYALRGVASDIGVGHTRLSFLSAFSRDKDGFSAMPAANLSWFMRNGQLSFTHYADFRFSEDPVCIPDMKTSVDMAFCLNGSDIFAEAAYDWVSSCLASLGGASLRFRDDVRMSVMLRFYPSGYTASRSAAARSTTKCSNEYASSLALDFEAGEWVALKGASGFGSSVRKHSGRASLDCAYFPVPKSSDTARSIQLKAHSELSSMLSESFRIKVRLSERVRTWEVPFRTDFRTDFSFLSRHFAADLRLNALICKSIGLLGYLEGGYKSDGLSLYVRQGFFRIDNWDDRIYAYERDAPGSFNVPAYYGRGLWTALTMNWRFARWGRMYIRAAMTAYPFMEEKKPGRAELKFNASFIF